LKVNMSDTYISYRHREIPFSRLAIDKFSETRSALIPDYTCISIASLIERECGHVRREITDPIFDVMKLQSHVLLGNEISVPDTERVLIRLVLFSGTIDCRFFNSRLARWQNKLTGRITDWQPSRA